MFEHDQRAACPAGAPCAPVRRSPGSRRRSAAARRIARAAPSRTASSPRAPPERSRRSRRPPGYRRQQQAVAARRGHAGQPERFRGAACPRSSPASWRSVVVARGQSCTSSMIQCAPLVTSAKSIGNDRPADPVPAVQRLADTSSVRRADDDRGPVHVLPPVPLGLAPRAHAPRAAPPRRASPRFGQPAADLAGQPARVSDRCGSAYISRRGVAARVRARTAAATARPGSPRSSRPRSAPGPPGQPVARDPRLVPVRRVPGRRQVELIKRRRPRPLRSGHPSSMNQPWPTAAAERGRERGSPARGFRSGSRLRLRMRLRRKPRDNPQEESSNDLAWPSVLHSEARKA